MRWGLRRWALVVAVLVVVGLPAGTLGRQTPAPTGTLNVYAMTLDSTSLPDGSVFEGETVLTAERLADAIEAIDPEALVGAGFDLYYLSSYLGEDASTRIRSYVSIWSSAEAATAGFAILEGDDAALLPDAELADEETEVGEEPREVTTGTYNEGEDTVSTIDTTFRLENVLVGVAVEALDGGEPEAELARELAEAMQARVAGVLAGVAPEGIDPALPNRVLNLEAQGVPIQVGYLTGAEVEALYGLSDSSLGGSAGSFVAAVALTDVDEPPPLLAAGATTLPDEDAAAEVVAQAGNLAPSVTNGEEFDVAVEGAALAAAFRYSSLSGGDEEQSQDSVRIVFNVGASVGVVDVRAAPSLELAEETAATLAGAQAACLAEGAAPCAAPELPGDFVPATEEG